MAATMAATAKRIGAWMTATPVSVLRLDVSRITVASCVDLTHDIGDGDRAQHRTGAQEEIPRRGGKGAATVGKLARHDRVIRRTWGADGLLCMALTTHDLEALAAEVHRLLSPGGLHVYTVRTTDDAHYGTGIARGDDMYEVGGFIVHFFSHALVERLSRGYELLDVAEFEEGDLPRRLFRVTLRKSSA